MPRIVEVTDKVVDAKLKEKPAVKDFGLKIEKMAVIYSGLVARIEKIESTASTKVAENPQIEELATLMRQFTKRSIEIEEYFLETKMAIKRATTNG